MARLAAVMCAHVRRRAPPWLAVVAVAIGCLAPGPESSAAAVPEGFDDQHVTTLPRPTAMAFTPDERLLIAGKLGALRVYEDDALLPTAALDLTDRVCSDSERGLLGIAVDPEFGANRFIYLYYTFNKFGVCDRNTPTAPVNRISRFVLGDDDLVDPVSELVLVDNIPSPDGIHNAGDLGFGKDGYLYASVGDGGCDFRGDSGCILLNDAARDLGWPERQAVAHHPRWRDPAGQPVHRRRHRPLQYHRPSTPVKALSGDLRLRAPQPVPVLVRSGCDSDARAHQRCGPEKVGGAGPRGRPAPTTAGTCARDAARPTRSPTAALLPPG